MGATSDSGAGRRKPSRRGRNRPGAAHNAQGSTPVSLIEPGDHLCLSSGDAQERQQIVSAYLQQGLDANDRVLCFFTDPRHDGYGLLNSETRQGFAAAGQLSVASTPDTFLDNGGFHPERAIDTLRQEAAKAVAAGWRGLRVTGDMWALRHSITTRELVDYELGLTEALKDLPASVLCRYDRFRCGADLEGRFLQVHPGRVSVDPWRSQSGMRVYRMFEPPGMRVEGNIDAVSGPDFAAALVELLEHIDDNGDTHLDMSELKFIDLNGLRELAWAASQLPEGRRLRLHHLAPHHRELITLLRWHELPELVLDGEGP
ncbi:MAG: MEDS domain-containing protein [Micromonosporaceae bacterium]